MDDVTLSQAVGKIVLPCITVNLLNKTIFVLVHTTDVPVLVVVVAYSRCVQSCVWIST